MCQFNLILVKNIKNKKILKDNAYNRFSNNINNFSPYVKGYCNCNSFVGSMSEYSGNSFLEMIESSNKSELQKLNQIKDFMNKPNYIELRQNYIKTRNSFSDVLEELCEPLSNYEMEQTNILEKKYKGKKLQEQIEHLYKELDNKLKKIQSSPEFKTAESKLNAFIEKNKLMEESTFYYLNKEEEYKECEYTTTNLSLFQTESPEDLNIFPECISIHEEDSWVIDDVIKKIQYKSENAYKEFSEYTQLFKKLLENEEYILFSRIWDEPKEMSIAKEVNIKNITIEDLASLEFNKMLKIYI